MTDFEDTEDDSYYDAVPLNSRPASILSRYTVFHSAVDISDFRNSTTMSDVNFSAIGKNMSEDSDDKSSQMIDDTDPDFILVWSHTNLSNVSLRRKNSKAESFESIARSKRDIFEQNLKEEGLILEYETIGALVFVKIFTPKDVLQRYCEILKLRMPMKEFPDQEEPKQFTVMTEVTSFLNKFVKFMYIDTDKFPPEKFKLTAEYSRSKHYLFDEESPNFFSGTIRSLVVDFILGRQHFSEDPDDMNSVGIHRLIEEGIYKAAYPLHDGDYNIPGSMRYLLYTEWATLKNWIKNQPIDHIKEYFGVKVALYFAWLGFYTHMLIPASIAGLTVFIYGIFTLSSNTVSQDICSKLNVTMCPLCDKTCGYWQLDDTCTYANFTYMFDNPLTVFFAFFMSVWATVFLELWKRYSASVTHRWGLTGFTVQAEHPRPQYLAKLALSKKKINVVTGALEPSVPFWKVKVPATLLSFSAALLLLFVALGAVIGIVLFRMCTLASVSLLGTSEEWLPVYANLIIPTTAAILNLFCITLLNYVYERMAVYLTELEYLRTQTEFDESLTLKIYLFQFINYYSSIVYMAFLKGKFVGYPAKYNRIFGWRQEECSPAGCLMELCIQLAIIMIGNQAVNSVIEMIIPPIMNWYKTKQETSAQSSLKSVSATASAKVTDDDAALVPSNKSWYRDYKFLDWGPRGLFGEYLEMVMQYGFVTLFVSAFPLAPVFALLNNIFEMRLDAQKFLRFYRRPVPYRAPNIGVWFRILDVLGKISVVSNAFIIAFSSNFIPRMVYKYVVNPDHTEDGFLDHTLAYFNTSEFEENSRPDHNPMNVTFCRYQQYRLPPWETDVKKRYKRPIIYWQVLVARLMFIVIFQNVVSLVTIAVQWLIPDMSARLRDQIKREAYLTSELIIRHEAQNKAAWTSMNNQHYEGLNSNGSGYRKRKTNSNVDESKL